MINVTVKTLVRIILVRISRLFEEDSQTKLIQDMLDEELPNQAFSKNKLNG